MNHWSVPQDGGIRKSFVGAAFMSSHSLFLNAISVPATAYIIRCLGPEGYGQWAMAISLVGATAVVWNLNFGAIYIRKIASDIQSAPEATANQLGVRLLLSCPAGGIALLISALMGYSNTVLACTAIGAAGMMLAAVWTTFGDLLQAIHRLPTLAMISVSGGLALTLMSVVAAWMGAGPVGMAASYLVGPIVTVGLLLYQMRRWDFPVRIHLSLRQVQCQLHESRFFAAQSIMNTASAYASMLILPKLVGAATFGLFAAGTLIATRLETIPTYFAGALYPGMAKAYADGSSRNLLTVLRSLGITLLICVPVSLAAFVLALPIAKIIFPKQADFCAQIIRITVWFLPLSGVRQIVNTALMAARREAAQLRLSIYSSTISIIVTIILVLQLGLIGACWAFLLRPVVGFLCSTLEFSRVFLTLAGKPPELPFSVQAWTNSNSSDSR